MRSNFSGFGDDLDIVAPGGGILSTVPNNGYKLMNGTSMAAPHVAGVAALILSVRPDLTGQQVRDIIEQTAQKVGGYSYTTHSNRPNGRWNNQMGYGLVDAYAAVYAIAPRIVGSNTICNQETYTIQNIPPNTQFTWQTSSNLQIVSSTNSSVTVKKTSSGSGYIKAVYGDVVITKNVYIGVPNISFTVLGLGGPYGQLDAVVTGGNPPYKWYKNGSLILTSSQQQVTLPFGCSGGLLKVSYSHNCGTGTYSEPVAACSNYYSIYPNPASGTVTIQLEKTEESSTGKLALNNAYRIDIYNMSGYMVRSVTAKENEVQIPLQGLLPGIYAVHLVKDGKVYKKKLVVE